VKTMIARCLLLLAMISGAAFAQGAGGRFDHLTTGYELMGAHRLVACESCHVDAVFKGTPRDCVACHSPGSRVGASPKTSGHILSTENCGACHSTVAFVPAVNFDHDQALGSCSSCHNGVGATGKPPGHMQTSSATPATAPRPGVLRNSTIRTCPARASRATTA
jgi:hypothetical protein